VSEKAAANNEIFRGVKLEQERVTHTQCFELAVPARLPEVDLFEIRAVPKEAIPLVVSDGDPRLHV
jgi:hypothetical protein